MTPKQKARFEAKFMPEPNSGCWLWFGSENGKGYGEIRINTVKYYAHRISYELYRGPIPSGLFVLHRCDTPACVNPDHFFLGTQADNLSDMVKKGRNKWAGRTHCNHGHELTLENVLKGKMGGRCRECHRTRSRLWMRKARARNRNL